MDSNQHQMQHGLEPSCNLLNPQQSGVANAGWKAFCCARPPDKLCSSSSTSSKALMPEPSADFYQPGADALLDAGEADETLMVTPELAAWQSGRLLVDDSSLRCLLPGAAVEQPRQKMSMPLCKTKTSDTRLQQPPPFGLREGMRQQSNLREGLLLRTSFQYCELPQQQLQQQQQQQSLLQESQFFQQLGTASPSSGFCSNAQQYLRNSQYLAPVQELLDEFCCLKSSNNNIERPNNEPRTQLEEGVSPSSCAQRHRLLLSLDIMELKKRMAKLVSMLEELDRRYRKYCEQMKAPVSSFEAVAGEGAAGVYTTLASKAMSRHFRYLRDGIVGQISETKNAIGEKDPVIATAGMTRGETPRLRLLVRYIRQQKAFQHAGVMEAHPWRPQRGLPERSVSVLRAWLFEHFLHPYPSDVDKHILARQTGLSRSQVCNWFINARVRLWKPMVEEMYSEETKEPALQSAQRNIAQEDDRLHSQSPNPNPRDVTQRQVQVDKKAGATLLVGSDADSLSSVVDSNHKSERREIKGGSKEACFLASRAYQQQPQKLAKPDNNFGVLDVDFSSGECSGQQNLGNSSTVSLTLGLQQNNGVGMSFSFIPPSQSSLLFSKEAIDNYHPMQFSILDGDVQNPPYRNFAGTQVLHDLIG